MATCGYQWLTLAACEMGTNAAHQCMVTDCDGQHYCPCGEES